MKEKNTLKWVSTYPFYIILGLLILVPTVFMLITSFLEGDSLGNILPRFTLSNYQDAVQPLYLKIFWNSIVIAVIVTGVTLLLAYPAAYFTARLPRKSQMIVLLLIMLPYWTNSLVRTYAFVILLRTEGFLNNLLMGLHILDEPVKMLYTRGAVIVGMVYVLLPAMFLPLYTSIESLDTAFQEASRDLGAGRARTFLHVILPLTRPGVITGCILVFIPTLGLFFVSDLLGGGKVVLLGNLIRDQFSVTRNLPLGSALSVIMMCLSLLFISLYLRMQKKEGQL